MPNIRFLDRVAGRAMADLGRLRRFGAVAHRRSVGSSAYDPKVDGVFDTGSYMDGELTLVFGSDSNLNKPGLAVFDNIDTTNRHSGYGDGHDHDHGSNAKLWDSICSDHG